MRESTRTTQSERCAVSAGCDGPCRESHLNKDGRVRCAAFFVETKEYKRKRGRRTVLKRSYRVP